MPPNNGVKVKARGERLEGFASQLGVRPTLVTELQSGRTVILPPAAAGKRPFVLAERKPVWSALSELFLDTDASLFRERNAQALAASPYSIRDLEDILVDEVYPVCLQRIRVARRGMGWLRRRMARASHTASAPFTAKRSPLVQHRPSQRPSLVGMALPQAANQ